MRRTQVIALLLVAIMAVTVLPAAAMAVRETNPAPVAQQTPIVGAYRTPAITAYATPMWPMRGQTYTVYGWLTWSGYRLPYQNIQVYWKYPGETTWRYWQTVRTNLYGQWSFRDYEYAQRAVQYSLRFGGDSVYYPVTRLGQIYVGYTYTAIGASNHYPAQYQNFLIYGYVANGLGQRLAYAPVGVYYRYWTGSYWSGWYYCCQVYTNGQGYYYKWDHNTRVVQYTLVYYGYPIRGYYSSALYWSSASPVMTIYTQ